jgi:hypothetical protein
MQVVEAFLCPSRTGTHLIDPIDYDIENPPSRTSYFALTATHFCNAKGIGYPPANARTLGDGIMTIPGSDRHCHASQARRVIDGLSRTLLFCESIEERYAAWIDGTSAWVVGAWPSNAISPHGEGGDATGFVTSINTKSAPYLPADRWSGSSERIFGPSTNHQAVTHAYADGQCTSISSNIDARLYLQLISRDDSESLHCCEERHAGVIAGPSAVEVDTAPNRVISLKNDVWGIDIPGAKDMWELEPKPIHEELQAIGPVKRARIVATMNTTNNTKTYNIMRKFIETKCIGPALVVRGHGQPAFLAAHDSLLDGKEPKRSFSFGEDLSIFFYTNSTFGLTIEAIVLKEKTIEVQYRFGVTGPHSRSHLALISLPKLDSGTYDVNMVRRPYHQPVARPLARAYDTYYNARVCTDCQFIVKKE